MSVGRRIKMRRIDINKIRNSQDCSLLLLSEAKKLSNLRGLNYDNIKKEMLSGGNKEKLITTFSFYFKEYLK